VRDVRVPREVEQDTACLGMKIPQQFAGNDGRAIVALVNCRWIVKAHNGNGIADVIDRSLEFDIRVVIDHAKDGKSKRYGLGTSFVI
jgi:hypothetical protein